MPVAAKATPKRSWWRRASKAQINEWRKSLSEIEDARFEKMWRRAKREGWQDFIRGKNDVLAMAEGCWFDWDKAELASNFFPEFLRHSKSPFRGQPFELLEWQKWDIIWPIFGWMRASGIRRFTKAYIEIPKKNGKSAIASGIGLYMLVIDDAGAPEVYAAATNGKQANIIHTESRRFVKASPLLRSRLKWNDLQKTITFPEDDGVFAVLSEEVTAQEGLNMSCGLIDEIHVFRSPKQLETLWFAGDAREQPLIFMITTAGEYAEDSIGWQTHEYARQVIDGTYSDIEYYACIYAAEKDDNLEDPQVWYKVNPSLGVTIQEEKVRAAIREAKNDPYKWNKLKRYRFNVWVQAIEAYFNIDHFKACIEPFTLDDLRGRPCIGGMDLSWSDDTTAFSLCFPPTKDDELWRWWEWYWIPEETVDARAKLNQQPYRHWVEHGWIETTPGDVIDLRIIRKRITEIVKPFRMKSLEYDPARATEIVQYLQDDGITMESFTQSAANFTAPMERIKELMAAGEMAHQGSPVTVWQMGNVIAKETVIGTIRPMKQNPTTGEKRRPRKIDGPVAMLMAFGCAMGDGVQESVYDRRGMIRL